MTSTTLQTEWPGIYYDGVSASPHRVTIQVRPSGLQIIAQSGSQLSWQYQEIRQTQGKYSGEEVRFERGSGICEVLTVSDTAILDCLHTISPDLVTHIHNPARRRWRMLMTGLAGLASIPLLWAAFTWGIPWVSGPVTRLIPTAWEKELGQFMATKLAPPETQCTNPQVVDSLETIVTTLAHSVELNPYSFQIHVVDSPTVNALAAPGGQILVFRGLLEHTETAEEMAGVLAHEMQHILQRHGMRLLVQNFSMGFVVGALSGDVSGIMTFGLQAAHVLQTLSYTRNVEEQADQEGLQLLLRSGIDPEGMLNFFRTINEKLNEKKKPSKHTAQYLHTHPSTEARIQRLQNLIPSTFKSSIELLPETEWTQIRKMCGHLQKTSA
ncbi:M48 family metallopeptidase [Candidatus Nitrospira salsa]|nr:MAG: metalloendopeptidase [Nitrospirales bacterium]